VEEGSVGTKRPLSKDVHALSISHAITAFSNKNSDKNAVSHQADLQMTILYL